jgi:phage host-nuclease inhibitor protein Gam|tara:strand:+ start:867 stop:1073 length:207 start_codon:yes stop_codon:yes gene_type:complete
MKKLVNGVLLDQTPEEIKELEDVRAEAKEYETNFDNEKAEKETKKASGKQKLKDLGLDDDEIQALLGV